MTSHPELIVFLLAIIPGSLHACPADSDESKPAARQKEWWETTAFYQIYPRSFKDSDGNGIGDLNGITSKLSYLRDIGVGATWLSPCFQSPMVDFGYDISDFYAIHSEYGTLDDFDALIVRAQEVNVKIILDFVPNHSSDQNEWFTKSVQRVSGFEDFYVWHPGYVDATNSSVRLPPSNWLSIFGGSAWTWNAVREEFYLHQFKPQQPDLNYRNERVVDEMKNVLRFWLERGVSGFRVDAIPQLFEVLVDPSSGRYPDEPLSGLTDDPNSYGYLNHTLTADLPETTDMVYQWRAVFDQFRADNGGDVRVMLLETNSTMDVIRQFYGNAIAEGAQMPFNFKLFAVNRDSTATTYQRIIDDWIAGMPAGRTANWVLGNHDNSRVATRLGVARIDLINTLLQTLPGASVTYYGDELGMTDVPIQSAEDRDPERTPFQWDASTSAGFSVNPTPWLPVAADYQTVNVAAEWADTRSHLSCYIKLLRLRRTATMRSGDLVTHVIRNVLILIRRLQGDSTYVILANFGPDFQQIDLRAVFAFLPDQLEFHVVCGSTFQRKGEKVDTNQIPVKANEAFILNALPMA